LPPHSKKPGLAGAIGLEGLDRQIVRIELAASDAKGCYITIPEGGETYHDGDLGVLVRWYVPKRGKPGGSP
jgi:hypothetical protein